MTARTILKVQWRALATSLREHFDKRTADPRAGNADRFVWEWWHVPGRYTHLRTPAEAYFPPALARRLGDSLRAFGRDRLGCADISPPWLSSYVEGCEQRLHADLPHGPWAYVLSLSRGWGRSFRGGETLILREDTLDWWESFRSDRGVEEPTLLDAHPPTFGQLLVFDPKLPHGVRRIEGTQDPRQGRLVVHGWFVQPSPYVAGPLRESVLRDRIEGALERLPSVLPEGLPIVGAVSIAWTVGEGGVPRSVRILSDNTRVPARFAAERRACVQGLRRLVAAMRFPPSAAGSRVTLPFVFER